MRCSLSFMWLACLSLHTASLGSATTLAEVEVDRHGKLTRRAQDKAEGRTIRVAALAAGHPSAKAPSTLPELGVPPNWDMAAEIGLWVPFDEWAPPGSSITPWWWGTEKAADVQLEAQQDSSGNLRGLRMSVGNASGGAASGLELIARESNQVDMATLRAEGPQYAARLMFWIPQVIFSNYTRDFVKGGASSELGRSRGTQLYTSTDELLVQNVPTPAAETGATEYTAVLAQTVPLLDYFRTGRAGKRAVHEGVVGFAPVVDHAGQFAGFNLTQHTSKEPNDKVDMEHGSTIPRIPQELAERELWVDFAHMGCRSGGPGDARDSGWCMAKPSLVHRQSASGQFRVETQQAAGEEVVEVTIGHVLATANMSKDALTPNYASELGLRTVLSSCARTGVSDNPNLSGMPQKVQLSAVQNHDGSAFEVYDFSLGHSANTESAQSVLCKPERANLLAQQGVWVPLAQYKGQSAANTVTPTADTIAASAAALTKHWKMRGFFDANGALERFELRAV